MTNSQLCFTHISSTTPLLLSPSSSITPFKFKGYSLHDSKTQDRFLMSLGVPLLNLPHTPGGTHTTNWETLLYKSIKFLDHLNNYQDIAQ
jgi:hypothetical protein